MTKKIIHKTFLLLFTLLIGLAIGGLDLYRELTQPVPDGLPIHIAVIGPLTGADAAIGTSLRRGVELRVEKLNKMGGVGGRPVVLDFYDDQNDVTKAREQARKIVADGQAVGVIGHWYSSNSLEGGKVYQDNGIPAITPGSTNVAVTKENPWYFRAIFNDRIQGRFLANYTKMVLDRKAVAIVSEKRPYGQFLTETFTQQAQKIGLNIVQKHVFATNDKKDDQFDVIVSKLKMLPDLDFVFMATHALEGAELLRKLRVAGIDVQVLGPDAMASKSFTDSFANDPMEQENPGHFTSGTLVTTPLIFPTANEAAQSLREDYLARFGEEPDWRIGYSYDAANIMLNGILKASLLGQQDNLSVFRANIRDALAGISTGIQAVDGVTGPIYFDKEGDAQKSILIGSYDKGIIVSALTQLQSI
ncbi:MAG: ABC transporter substrate-binding protein, partial [Magnetococcales bacterium]|nr:ABC transporter substrate-binding protein [Magnetococcales bacterium]